MRLERNERAVLLWLATAGCAAFGFWGFATAVPWTFNHIVTTRDAAVLCPGVIDPAWPAVHCYKGRPLPWTLGFISDHPIRYAGAIVQMLVGWGAFLAGVMYTKRFR